MPRITNPGPGTTTGASGSADPVAANPAPASPPASPAAGDAAGPPAAVFDRAAVVPEPGVVPGSPLHGGLPAVLLDRAGGGRVVHGDDPGDFYCEHMFFSAQQAATSSPTLARNAEGEKLVGFLHCPWDAETSRDPAQASYTLAQRHGRTREVVGAALKGWFDDAQATVQGPVKMLVTGYDRFMSARNNPTGEFVTAQENLDAALVAGFGADLKTQVGKSLPADPADPPDVMRLSYTVTTPAGDREVVLRAQRFPVDDRAIDEQQATSIQAAIATFAPHAVLSMGVAPGSDFKAEFHADDGGLVSVAGKQRHDRTARPRTNLPDNYALARAIARGAASPVQSPLAVRTDPIV
jgi:pyrrolidone-carboxylate peptidase